MTARRRDDAEAIVIGSKNGEDALRQLGPVNPDLLLINPEMRRLVGFGLIRRLKELRPGEPTCSSLHGATPALRRRRPASSGRTPSSTDRFD